VVGPVENVWVNGSLWASDAVPTGAKLLAYEGRRGSVIGWKKGSVTWLGLEWKHAIRQHAAMMRVLLDNQPPAVLCDNPNVWTSLRSLPGRGRSMLFAMNLFTSRMTARIRVGQFETGEFTLGPMDVRTFAVTGI
jgi:hypothetical protein